jgi:hypothetical protein
MPAMSFPKDFPAAFATQWLCSDNRHASQYYSVASDRRLSEPQGSVKIRRERREKLLVAMASGYLDPTLGTTRYFRNPEQSEEVGVSFLLGKAFTQWYAQDRIRVEAAKQIVERGNSRKSWIATTSRHVTAAILRRLRAKYRLAITP